MDIVVTEEFVRALARDREREARSLRAPAERPEVTGQSPRSWLAGKLIELGMLLDGAAGRRALHAGGEGGR